MKRAWGDRREIINLVGGPREKNGVNGKLKICDEISEARTETTNPSRWFAVSGVSEKAALG